MVQVINIKQEHERLLFFLFPHYASCPEGVVFSENFIAHRDITSKTQRESLEVRHKNCIIISKRLFDEIWDETVLEAKAIEFSRIHLKNRKRTTGVVHDEHFVDNIIKYIFYQDAMEEQDKTIYNLFDNFGSKNFNRIFLELSENIPVQILMASMNTFVYKIMQPNNPSLYYKKKAILFKDKIQNNFIKAHDNYVMRERDQHGLSYIKYCNDLISTE